MPIVFISELRLATCPAMSVAELAAICARLKICDDCGVAVATATGISASGFATCCMSGRGAVAGTAAACWCCWCWCCWCWCCDCCCDCCCSCCGRGSAGGACVGGGARLRRAGATPPPHSTHTSSPSRKTSVLSTRSYASSPTCRLIAEAFSKPRARHRPVRISAIGWPRRSATSRPSGRPCEHMQTVTSVIVFAACALWYWPSVGSCGLVTSRVMRSRQRRASDTPRLLGLLRVARLRAA